MRNFMIAAVTILAFAGFVASAEARSQAEAMNTAEHFAQELKSSGQFEIGSSQLALKTSINDEVKKFAQKMIDDHTAADKKLAETLKQANLPQPKYGMDEDKRGLVEQLAVFQGAAFDRAYVRDQFRATKRRLNFSRPTRKAAITTL